MPENVRHAVDMAESKAKHSEFWHRLDGMNDKLSVYKHLFYEKMPRYQKVWYEKKMKEEQEKVRKRHEEEMAAAETIGRR